MGAEHLDEDLAAADRRLWQPPAEVVEDLAAVPGDVLLVGAGGKLGLSLARMARLAADAKDFYAHYQLASLFARQGDKGFAEAVTHYREAAAARGGGFAVSEVGPVNRQAGIEPLPNPPVEFPEWVGRRTD